MRYMAAAFITVLAFMGTAHAQQDNTTPTPQITATPAPLTGDEKLDINTATAVDLERLPGIGPKLAQAIVQHRETQGEFVLPADVMRVPGIREGRFAQIKPYITADNDGTMLWRKGDAKPAGDGKTPPRKPSQRL